VGRTKTEVRDKLKELHKQVESGLRPRRRYTVGDALDDWLAVGVNGLSARTVTLYRDTIGKALGTPLDDHNVRRQFRVITHAAGLGSEWVPRELRHTFVSLLSAHGVPVEAIALLAGHNQTSTTELVHRHQIVPALTRGAKVMDQIFG
jgi:integrase